MSNLNSTNPTIQLAKDFGKCMVLDGRKNLAAFLYYAAEKIDITEEQETFCSNFHRELQAKRVAREAAEIAKIRHFAKVSMAA